MRWSANRSQWPHYTMKCDEMRCRSIDPRNNNNNLLPIEGKSLWVSQLLRWASQVSRVFRCQCTEWTDRYRFKYQYNYDLHRFNSRSLFNCEVVRGGSRQKWMFRWSESIAKSLLKDKLKSKCKFHLTVEWKSIRQVFNGQRNIHTLESTWLCLAPSIYPFIWRGRRSTTRKRCWLWW